MPVATALTILGMSATASITAAAPAPQVIRFDGGRADWATTQMVDAAGNVYIGGSTEPTGSGNITFTVVKLNALGGLIWRATCSGSGGGGFGHAAALAVDTTGNVYVVGNIGDIWSYLSTAAKHGLDHLDVLVELFTTGPWLPPDPAPG